MNEVEKAYTAGIIDGEGCLSITLHRTKRERQILHRISVNNTNKALIEWLVEKTKLGHLYSYSGVNGYYATGNRKPPYVWTLCAGAVRELLPEIMPYLVLKRRQAELMLESLGMRNLKGRGKGRSLSEEENKRRNEIVVELHKLNHRGLT